MLACEKTISTCISSITTAAGDQERCRQEAANARSPSSTTTATATVEVVVAISVHAIHMDVTRIHYFSNVNINDASSWMALAMAVGTAVVVLCSSTTSSKGEIARVCVVWSWDSSKAPEIGPAPKWIPSSPSLPATATVATAATAGVDFVPAAASVSRGSSAQVAAIVSRS